MTVRWRLRIAHHGPALAVFGVALAVRLALIIRSGGFLSDYGYDPSVYYAAGDALIHGRVPYADYVLLHPPGIALVTTPFALLGRLTSDHVGYLTANLAFTVIGALNAVLVRAVATRLGAGRRAALMAGLFYAVWLVPGVAEYLVRLEPLGNLLLLGALWFVAREGGPHRLDAVAAGVLLAAACNIKIWFVVPFLLVGVWLLRRAGARSLGQYAAGAAAAFLLVDGPFALLAGRSMWTMVVTAQLGRRRTPFNPDVRLRDMAVLGRIWPHAAPAVQVVLTTLIVLAVCVVVRRAWPQPAFRPILALAAAQAAVLLACPSWSSFYPDFGAVPAALLVAGALAPAGARRPARHWAPAFARPARVAPVAVAAALTVIALATGSFRAVLPWRGTQRLTAAVSGDRCVSSDSPDVLIQLNVLDRDFADGCPVWVDVTGKTYLPPDRASVGRTHNQRWQRDLVNYLLAGQATILRRPGGDGLTRASLRALADRRLRVDPDNDAVLLGGRRVP